MNDYRINCYFDSSRKIASGKKGILNVTIYEDDVDEKMKDFKQIECEFAIVSKDDKEIFVRPVIIDREAISFK